MSLKVETFNLIDGREDVTLTSYVADAPVELPFNNKRRAMLICPGGGYGYCSEREAEPVALAYLAAGFNTFVLKYSVKDKARFPEPLLEACKAMAFIKDNAERFRIYPEYVFISGFSAGGHLAASVGTMWNRPFISEALNRESGCFKPAGMVLAYPVINGIEKTHRGSIDNLLGEKREDEEARRSVSLQLFVTKDTCPAFIWHTATDGAVPVENSLILATALATEKIPFELHVFPKGAHGMSLCNDIVMRDGGDKTPEAVTNRVWLADSVRWMKSL